MQLTITTNNHWHDFIEGYELSEKERKEFDYLNWDLDQFEGGGEWERRINAGKLGMESRFIRYRGLLYYDEFMAIDPMWKLHYPEDESGFDTWHGYISDSFFSGLLIRYSEDCVQYQIATYMS